MKILKEKAPATPLRFDTVKQGNGQLQFYKDDRVKQKPYDYLQVAANKSQHVKQLAHTKKMADDFSEDLVQPLQRKMNNTGLPDNLKSGIENLSGISMDDVKVHYNSAKPAQLQAHAFAQGNQIHVAGGQEKHLPHEAWHVVQQKQGRVKPSYQLKTNVPINDDESLEKEADIMGSKALQMKSDDVNQHIKNYSGVHSNVNPIQRRLIVQGTNADFKAALRDVLNVIRSSANSQTKTLIHYAETLNYVDLVFKNDIPWYKIGLEGLTTEKVRYGTPQETHINQELLRKNTALNTHITDRLTIEIRVGLPILAFWNRNQGRLASTLLHELTIHAARYVALIDRMRLDDRADHLLSEPIWSQIKGVFDINDSHHAALKVGNTEDEFRKQYRDLTNSLIDYYRNRGKESQAMSLHKAYWDDLWEHSPGVFPKIAQLFGITLSDDI